MSELQSSSGIAPVDVKPMPKSGAFPLLFRAWSEGYISMPDQAGAHELKRLIGAAAWRLICRSSPRDVIAVIHDGAVGLDQVFEFFWALVDRGWQALPTAHLVGAHLAASRRVFVSEPKLPHEPGDLALLRLADRGNATATEYITALRWAALAGVHVTDAHQWASINRRAAAWHRSGQGHQRDRDPWHFFCRDVEWRGYQLVPLTSAIELWEEGDAMSHCIYDLRRLCDAPWPSRFFSLRRAGRRVGTVELTLAPPEAGMRGLNRTRGRWVLMDFRLSANRIPGRSLAIDMLEFGNQYDEWSMRPARRRCLHRPSGRSTAG